MEEFTENELLLLKFIQNLYPKHEFLLKPNTENSCFICINSKTGIKKDILLEIREIPEELKSINLSNEDILEFSKSSLHKQIKDLLKPPMTKKSKKQHIGSHNNHAGPFDKGPSIEFLDKVRDKSKKHNSIAQKTIKKIVVKKRRNFVKNEIKKQIKNGNI